jgi:hypothetical protein
VRSKNSKDFWSESTAAPSEGADDCGPDEMLTIILSGDASEEHAPAFRASAIEEDDEQAVLADWARWQARRQKRLGKRSLMKDKYNSVNGEHRLGICSSDCLQCKAIGGEPPPDIVQ